MAKSLTYGPPIRVWRPTGNLTPDGKRKFSSREWQKGEKVAYMKTMQMDTSKLEEGGKED